ncbi:hypothetical protein AMTRI_Chr08g208180 [Amborella trichopoda]
MMLLRLLFLLFLLSFAAALQPLSGNKLLGSWFGRGFQVYKCKSGNYSLDHAEATLYEWGGAKSGSAKPGSTAGRHYFLPFPDGAGRRPTWSLFDAQGIPSSTVNVMESVSRVGTIPDLLLQASSHSCFGGFAYVSFIIRDKSNAGTPPGAGECYKYNGIMRRQLFGPVKYVQRVHTSGGLSPINNQEAKVGDLYASPYTAVYWFYYS